MPDNPGTAADIASGPAQHATASDPGPASKPSLFQKLRDIAGREVFVLIAATAGTNVVRLVGTMVLTRLLAPEIFGSVGIIASLFFVLGMITDLGFQSFIVRHPRGNEQRFIDVIWTFHAIRGVILTLIAILLAGPAAYALGKPELAMPLAVASATFAIGGFASLSLFTAIRNGLVRRLSLFDLALIVFQTIVSIVAAAMLQNVWAIIVGIIAHAVVRAVLSYVVFPDATHSPKMDRDIWADFWAFSHIILKSSTLSVVLSQADKLVLARLFAIDTFGLYVTAASLAAVPFTFAVAYTSRILYPRYAEAWRSASQDLGRLYYATRRRVSLIYGFAAGGLIGGAPLVIQILYDPRYHDAATFLTLLAISPALVVTTSSGSEFLMATGNPRATLYANVARVAWLLVIGTIGLVTLGPIGVAVAAGTIEIAPLILIWTLLRRAGVLDMRQEMLFLITSLAGVATGYGVTLAVLPFI